MTANPEERVEVAFPKPIWYIGKKGVRSFSIVNHCTSIYGIVHC
jgi:hypothetical protein